MRCSLCLLVCSNSTVLHTPRPAGASRQSLLGWVRRSTCYFNHFQVDFMMWFYIIILGSVFYILSLSLSLHVQTSIMAVQYDKGVVFGADSRTSSGYTRPPSSPHSPTPSPPHSPHSPPPPLQCVRGQPGIGQADASLRSHLLLPLWFLCRHSGHRRHCQVPPQSAQVSHTELQCTFVPRTLTFCLLHK